MKFGTGIYCASRASGDEAERIYREHEAGGLESVTIEVDSDGGVCGLIHMAGVSAHFDVTFESLDEAVEMQRKVIEGKQ